jgi:hypothetical protein
MTIAAVMITPITSTPAIAPSPITTGHGLCGFSGGGPPGVNEFSFAGQPAWGPRFGAGGIAPYPSGGGGGGGGVGVVISPLPE